MKYKNLKIGLLLTLLILLLTSCGKSNNTDDSASSRATIDWAGYYQGVIPRDDQQGVYVDLELNKDNTFVKRSKNLRYEDKLITVEGTFSWSEDGNQVILESDAEAYDSILLIQEDRVLWKKIQEVTFRDEDMEKYVLTKIPGILQEKEWVVKKMSGKPVNILAKGTNKHINIHFDSDENRAYGFGGCNFFRTSYFLVDNEITFSPVISTKMAGPNIEIENTLFRNLRNVKQYEIVGNELFLMDENGLQLISAKVTQ